MQAFPAETGGRYGSCVRVCVHARVSPSLASFLTLVDIRTHDAIFAVGSCRWIGAFDFWHVTNHYS